MVTARRQIDGYVAEAAPSPRLDNQGYVLDPATATSEHTVVYSIPMDAGQDGEPASEGAGTYTKSVLYCIPPADVGDEVSTSHDGPPRSCGPDPDGKSSSA